MTVIDALVITLGLDPEGVKKGMRDAEGTMQSGLSKIGNMLKNFAAPIAGAFAVGALFNSYVNGADAVGKLSTALGVGVEDMQAWGEATKRAGGTVEGFYSSLGAMNEKVQEYAKFGEGEGKKIFESLGIAVKDAGGNVRDTTAIMADLAEKAESMDKAQFAGIAKKLGIDQGTIMLLQQGRQALDEAILRQKELGVYTKQDTEISAKFNDTIADLWQSMKGGSAILLRMIVPAITKFVEWITKGVKFMHEHEKFVQIFFIGLAAAISIYAIPALLKLAAAAAMNPFTWLIAGAAALALVLEDLYVWMNGGKAQLGDFWSKFGTPDEVKKKVEGFIETLKNLTPTVLEIAKWIGKMVATIWTIQGAVNVVKMINSAFETLYIKGLYAADGVKAIYSGFETLYIKGLYAMDTIKSGMETLALKTMYAKEAVIQYATAGVQHLKQLAAGAKDAAVKGFTLLWQSALKAGTYIMTNVVPAVWSFTAALLANPITWVIAGIVALIAVLYLLYKHWDTVKAGAQALWDGLVSIFSGAVDWFAGIFSGIVDAVAGPFMAAFDKISAGWQKVKSFFGFDSAGGTTGGLNYIGGLGGAPIGGNASQSISPASVRNSSNSYQSDTSVSVGKVEVVTQATDAQGISKDIGKGLQKDLGARFKANQANVGVVQ